MKHLLICPGPRPAVGLLSETVPLSNVRLLGQGLLEYWLSHLACHRAKHVLVLAHDRPEQVQALVGDGARWGLHVRVFAESRELTPAEAENRYGQAPAEALPEIAKRLGLRQSSAALDGPGRPKAAEDCRSPRRFAASADLPPLLPSSSFSFSSSEQTEDSRTTTKARTRTTGTIVLDHFPGFPDQPLFTGYADWFAGLLAWIPHALTPDRVGVREVRPGIWIGLRSRISPAAQLQAPCWLGRNVYVGPRAVVGPEAILEDGAMVEPGAQVARSRIGPHTYVGKSARITDSLAWGNTLLDWRSGSVVSVADPLLLCGWRRPRPRAESLRGWLARLAERSPRHNTAPCLLWRHVPLNKES